MKTLKLDEKFSIVYDDENNDRPHYVLRHGHRHSNIDVGTPNWISVMFYALLEKEAQVNRMAEYMAKQHQADTDIDAEYIKAQAERLADTAEN